MHLASFRRDRLAWLVCVVLLVGRYASGVLIKSQAVSWDIFARTAGKRQISPARVVRVIGMADVISETCAMRVGSSVKTVANAPDDDEGHIGFRKGINPGLLPN